MPLDAVAGAATPCWSAVSPTNVSRMDRTKAPHQSTAACLRGRYPCSRIAQIIANRIARLRLLKSNLRTVADAMSWCGIVPVFVASVRSLPRRHGDRPTRA